MDYSIPWTRELCYAKKGVVAALLPQAADAGLAVLRQGGNAADAAIATAAVMNVIGPGYSGLGGDAFILYYDAATQRVTGINGSGRAPRAATVEYYQRQGLSLLPDEGIHSASVPGAVDAYVTALELFGTMPLGELLQPAIEFAEHGVLRHIGARQYLADHKKLNRYPSSAAIYGADGRLSPRAGLLINEDLGKSLRLIAEGGRDAFYKGEIARAIVACSAAHGGLFATEDFADHASDVYAPLRTDYRGHTVYQTALPSQGHIVLEELNILEGYDLTAMGFGSADCIHHMAEAKKLAFADRLAYAGDPDFVQAPVEEMISKPFARQRRGLLDPRRAQTAVTPGNIHRDGDTTSLCVVDQDGNAASLIISLSSYLGSGLVAEGTGILLNNRIGSSQGFFFDPDHPDRLQPGKRTVHTLNTFVVCRGDALYFVGNTPGGDMQPQLNLQTITNIIDFGMTPQEAVEAPAWISHPGTSPEEAGDAYALRLDARYEAAGTVVEDLQRRGHVVQFGGLFGERKAIMRDPDSGVYIGGAQCARWF